MPDSSYTMIDEKLLCVLARMSEAALAYQRRCRDATNMADLLAHLFLGAQQSRSTFLI